MKKSIIALAVAGAAWSMKYGRTNCSDADTTDQRASSEKVVSEKGPVRPERELDRRNDDSP